MEIIDNLTSIEGRRFLQKLFFSMRYEKQMSSFSALIACLRICISEKDTSKFINTNVTITHQLGVLSGTKLWLEEVVHRYYFTTINSFVYFGAAILLVIVGFRKFYNLDSSYVIGGLIFEASLLMLMFVTMLFSPSDGIEFDNIRNDDSFDLIEEIGEISTDFAKSVDKLDVMNTNIENLIAQQSEMLKLMEKLIQNNLNLTTPNSDFVNAVKANNDEINNFTDKIKELNTNLELIKSEQIKFEVKSELEKMLNKNIFSI